MWFNASGLAVLLASLFVGRTLASLDDAVVPLRVASLNTWGLLISKQRALRMSAIASYFSKSDLDIVLLQEVWLESDYTSLDQSMHAAFPYSQYYPAGIFGSGLAIFSRFPIVDVGFMRYSLAGRPERMSHGDWYAGKGVALARIRHSRLGIVNVFTTHTVAGYRRSSLDGYYALQRLTEMYELLRYVDSESSPSHITIVGGDLNDEPAQPSYSLTIGKRALYTPRHGHLRSVWEDNADVPVEQRMTSGLEGNSFTKSDQLTAQLDHLFYIPNGRIHADQAEVILTESIPDADLSYSDHAAISSTFACRTSRQFEVEIRPPSPSAAEDVLNVLDEMKQAIEGRQATIRNYKVGMAISILLLLSCTACVFILHFHLKGHWAILVAAMLMPLATYIGMVYFYLGMYATPEELSALREFQNEWTLWASQRLPAFSWPLSPSRLQQ